MLKYVQTAASLGIFTLGLIVPLASWGETATPAFQVYRLQTMGALQISIPVDPGITEAKYRTADGKWRALPGQIKDGVLQLSIELSDIENGRTTLLIGVPKGVNMDDQQPPTVVRFEVDGTSYGAVNTVNLGGVKKGPEKVVIEVKDKLNALQLKSLRVNVNGKAMTASEPGIAFQPTDPKSGVITIDLKQLLPAILAQNSVSVYIDDCAVDDEAPTCSLSFRYIPPQTLADGTVVSIDSFDSNPGWAKWWVMFDGVKMDTSYSTTAGYTWLSAGDSQPHWVRLEFPKPKPVKEVAIWWAYYQGYRTSVAYKVETLQGDKWVTQAEVKDQKPMQVSRHSFGPVETKAVRVWQSAMAGHPTEPQIMWISELEVNPLDQPVRGESKEQEATH